MQMIFTDWQMRNDESDDEESENEDTFVEYETEEINDGEDLKHQEGDNFDDIGRLTNEKGKLDDTELTDSQKYSLKHHFTPPPNFKFPLSTFRKQSRKASQPILKESYVFSAKDDSIWCVSCAVFTNISKQKLRESFANTGFKN